MDKVKSIVYQWKPEFKYSTRVFCTYAVCILVIYEVAVGIVIVGGFLYKQVHQYLVVGDVLTSFGLNISQAEIRQDVFIGFVSWNVGAGISCVLCLVLIANMLAWYRGHLARLQRGEKGFLPVNALTNSPSSITVATLKYSGYQVAYIAWGFVIMHVLLFAICTVVGIQILQPVVDGSFNSFIWRQLFVIWPAILVSVMIILIQMVLARFVFLHDNGSALALNNRRLFHICTYFLFFFNIYLGVVSCLSRILIGAAIGVFFLARTQKSLVPRDFELRDPGFNAYVGYLYLEHTHSNPVLVTFCRLLVMATREKRRQAKLRFMSSAANAVNTDSHPLEYNPAVGRHRRVRRRWTMLLTLINNPSLCTHRRREKFTEKTPFQALKVLLNDFTQSNYGGYWTDGEGNNTNDLSVDKEDNGDETQITKL